MGDEADWLIEREYGAEPDEVIDFDGTIAVETDKAVLFRREGALTAEWVPKSQIVERVEGRLTVTWWIAEQKGWIEEEDDPDLDDGIPF